MGWSPLHLSQLHDHKSVSVRLLEAGADKDLLDNNGVKARDANKAIRIWSCTSMKPSLHTVRQVITHQYPVFGLHDLE